MYWIQSYKWACNQTVYKYVRITRFCVVINKHSPARVKYCFNNFLRKKNIIFHSRNFKKKCRNKHFASCTLDKYLYIFFSFFYNKISVIALLMNVTRNYLQCLCFVYLWMNWRFYKFMSHMYMYVSR